MTASADTPAPGIYEHFKGMRYRVEGVAKHSETGEQVVVYRALYGEKALWVRPLAMFMESVERDGAVHKRFTRVADE